MAAVESKSPTPAPAPVSKGVSVLNHYARDRLFEAEIAEYKDDKENAAMLEMNFDISFYTNKPIDRPVCQAGIDLSLRPIDQLAIGWIDPNVPPRQPH